MTIRGVIRPVTLQAVYLGHVADPRGGQRAVFTADGTLDWEDWGLAWNVPSAAPRCWSPKDVRIEIGLEAGAPAMTTRQPGCRSDSPPYQVL